VSPVGSIVTDLKIASETSSDEIWTADPGDQPLNQRLATLIQELCASFVLRIPVNGRAQIEAADRVAQTWQL
jgi:hypothetical protein